MLILLAFFNSSKDIQSLQKGRREQTFLTFFSHFEIQYAVQSCHSLDKGRQLFPC
jgi:hypothetical protein